MTEHEREIFRMMVEKLQAMAQNPRFTEDCRAAARVLAERMLAPLPMRRRA